MTLGHTAAETGTVILHGGERQIHERTRRRRTRCEYREARDKHKKARGETTAKEGERKYMGGDREKHNVRKGESEWDGREGFEKENARNKLEKETTLARSVSEREKGTRSGQVGNRLQEGSKG
jgi:hypothetical protein